MSGLSRLNRPEGLPEKVCIFGAPKSGKTTLAGQLAEVGFNLIYLDVAREGSVLLKLSDAAQERITYVPIMSTSDTPLAHNTVDKLVRGGNFRLCGLHGRVDCPFCKKAGRDDWMDVSIPTERTMENKDTIVIIDNMSEVSTAIACNIQKGKNLIAPIPEMDKETVQRVAEKEAFEDYHDLIGRKGYRRKYVSLVRLNQAKQH